jgi:hypothetical protein
MSNEENPPKKIMLKPAQLALSALLTNKLRAKPSPNTKKLLPSLPFSHKMCFSKHHVYGLPTV